jgi:septum site-determining protein MinC
LVILAAVCAGAEVMAEGNIHIYGVLRGRALAGVQGDENSRIFCSNLQAELISIAGNYQVSDNINDKDRGKPVQIQLDKQKLIVNTL